MRQTNLTNVAQELTVVTVYIRQRPQLNCFNCSHQMGIYFPNQFDVVVGNVDVWRNNKIQYNRRCSLT